MRDDYKTTISNQSRVTLGLVLGLLGTASWATAIKVQGDYTAERVEKIELSRALKSDKNEAEHRLMLKWLVAIGQKLNVPEPPRP